MKQPPCNDPDCGEVYYTTSEVLAILKVSETTLWRKWKFEGLRKVKIGGTVRYRKSVLDQWLADHEADHEANHEADHEDDHEDDHESN